MDEATVPHNTVARTEGGVKTAVLLCHDIETLGAGLALEELRLFLENRFPDLSVEVVPGPCQQPGRLFQSAAGHGAAGAVLGVCSGDYSEIELQARARKSGLDPFGVEVVSLGMLCAGVPSPAQATRKAKALLAAAVARARAYQGSGPEQAKPYLMSWEQGVSRRSLFTLPPIGYQPVPGFRQQFCAAASGCDLCVKACPRDALSREGEQVNLSKTRCEGCGVCLTACPRGAIDIPGWSLPQFEAQVPALLDPEVVGPESPALVFTCHRAADSPAGRRDSSSPHWLPVVVPCLGMVTPAWVLQALAHGAPRVALLMCGQRCPLGQRQAINGTADFCRHLLERLGQDACRVAVLTASGPEALPQAPHCRPRRAGAFSPQKRGGPLRLGATEGALEAIQRLAGERSLASGMEVAHPYSPFGVVELCAQSCTGCLACAQACPTGALALERKKDSAVLTYEASLCNGCRICADVCPEAAAGALAVRRMTRLDALSAGRVTLHKARMAVCDGCGEAFASQAMLRRIGAQMGEDNTDLNTALSRYCPSCRMTFALGARPAS